MSTWRIERIGNSNFEIRISKFKCGTSTGVDSRVCGGLALQTCRYSGWSRWHVPLRFRPDCDAKLTLCRHHHMTCISIAADNSGACLESTGPTVAGAGRDKAATTSLGQGPLPLGEGGRRPGEGSTRMRSV